MMRPIKTCWESERTKYKFHIGLRKFASTAKWGHTVIFGPWHLQRTCGNRRRDLRCQTFPWRDPAFCVKAQQKSLHFLKISMEMSVRNILKCGEYVDYISKMCVYTYIYIYRYPSVCIYANESNATNDMKLSAKVRGSGRDCFWQQNQQNPFRDEKNGFHRSQSLGSLNPNPPKSLRWAEKVWWLSGTTTSTTPMLAASENEWLKHFKTNAEICELKRELNRKVCWKSYWFRML